MKTTQYFQYTRHREDRKGIKDEWIYRTIAHPLKEEIQQTDGRIKKWAKIDEAGKYLREIRI